MNNDKINIPPFYPGQRLICCAPNNARGWVNEDDSPVEGPDENEVVICTGCFMDTHGWAVFLKGYGNGIDDGFYVVDYETGIVLFKPAEEIKYPLISLSRVLEKEKHLLCAS